MMSRRPQPKWVILGILVVGMLLYRAFIYRPGIVRPSPWQISSSAGVGALEDGRLDEAEQHFFEAMEEANTFAETDARRGTSLHNLANLRFHQKRFDEADRLYRQALPFLETGQPDHELEIGALLDGLAAVCVARRDFGEAEALLRRAVEINRRHRGENDPVVANNLRAQAAVLLAQGKFAAAVSPATQAAQIEATRRGADAESAGHPAPQHALSNTK